MVSVPPPLPDVEDATRWIVTYIRQRGPEGDKREGVSSHSYDVYVRNVLAYYLRETGGAAGNVWDVVNVRAEELSPVFVAAAWELCRRGVLRPGGRSLKLHGTDEGRDGFGYSITSRGREWLAAAGGIGYIPLEPGRFARMLAERGGTFGPGFVERSQEAVRAYDAQAYLACCAMCGAAAESLILALAIAKLGDEGAVLRDYSTSGGRGRLERRLLQGLPPPIEAEFRRYTDLLKYWRDSTSHGRAVHMTEAEAFGALILLLRFAIFASEHQVELIRR